MYKSKFFAVLLIAAFLSLTSFNNTAQAIIFSGNNNKNYQTIDRLIEKGNYNAALAEVNKLLSKNPEDLNAKAFLGNIYSAQNKFDKALKEFVYVLGKDQKNAYAHNGLGMAYYRRISDSNTDARKKSTELMNFALQEFLKAIECEPSYYQAHNNAGKILFELGRIDESESYFKKARKLKPDYSEAVENCGRILFSKGQINDAINDYLEAIRLDTKNSSAYYLIGEALIAKGKYSEAIKHLKTSLYLFPNSAPVHNMLGKAYEMQSNELAAAAEYRKASLINPDYTSPYLSLAEIHKNRGDEELAVAELRNAISVNPNFYEAKARIADISMHIGRVDHSIIYYKSLLDTPQYQNRALIGLSRAYFIKAQQANSFTYRNALTDLEAVEKALKTAVKYDSANPELYLALLRMTRILQKEDQAKAYMQTIMQNSGDNKVDHIIKGESYIVYKQFNNAEKEFVQALNKSRGTDDLLKMTELFIINRSYSAARIALNRVLGIEPDNLLAMRLIHRIDKYEEQATEKLRIARDFYADRKYPAAIEAYRDTLALNPYNANAHIELARAFEKKKYYFNAIEHYKAYLNLADVSCDCDKYEKKINKLTKKINKMKKKNKEIKKFSQI